MKVRRPPFEMRRTTSVTRRLLFGPGLATAAALVLLQGGAYETSARAQTGSRAVALRGGTVLTVTHGTIPVGTVLLRDGRIAAVGADVDIPAGAEIIDVSGRFVTPGLIDAHSHIATDSLNESGTTVSSMTSMEDVLNPTDVNIYRALAGGVTTANILHGSANPVGGKNVVVKFRWGRTRAGDLLFDGAMPSLKLALGENPKQLPRQLRAGPDGPLRYPTTRPGIEFVIRDAFTRAKAYQKARRVLPQPRDLQLEPLVEVLEGRRLVHAHAYRADEILMLMRLAEEMGFRIGTFHHVLEGYRVAKEMAAHGAGGSTFADWWGYKAEAMDATPYNAAIMLRKGVLVSINSDSAEHARRLNTEAAKSIKWGGLTDDEALALVTINPARQLHLDARVGSLEQGKDADLVVWTHHPLSSYAIVDRTYLDGVLYYDREHDPRRPRPDEDLEGRQRRTVPETEPADPVTSDLRRGGPAVWQEEAARAGARNGEGVVAIVNATLHPISRPSVTGATLLISGGRIQAVGQDLAVPQGARVIDAQRGDVYPGFIDAATTVGLDEPGPRGFGDVGERLDNNAHLRTRVAYHVESDAVPVARVNGVTTAALVQSGGTFGGEVPVMNFDGWTWEEATVRPNAGIQFTFPALGTWAGGPRQQSHGAPYEDLRRQRARKLQDLLRLFEEVRAYARRGPDRPTDWTLEAFVPVVERRLPLITRVDREGDIREALAFADRARVNMVIAGAAEAGPLATLLRQRNIPVILGNRLTLPVREEDFHAAGYALAGELARAGVRVAFSSGDSTTSRLLPYNAAISVAWGMDRQDALRALTLDAAAILGVADRLGSLDPGKDANLFICRGDPLEVRTQVTHVFIQGRDVGLANRHLALYEKYANRP